MGSAKKAFTKIAKSAGILKKVPKAVQPLVNAGAALEAGRDPTDRARTATELASERRVTRAERTEAAKRRARRAGRRGLMMAGRLGGGGQEEGTKTTLGA
jgi:hypothetical protein